MLRLQVQEGERRKKTHNFPQQKLGERQKEMRTTMETRTAILNVEFYTAPSPSLMVTNKLLLEENDAEKQKLIRLIGFGVCERSEFRCDSPSPWISLCIRRATGQFILLAAFQQSALGFGCFSRSAAQIVLCSI